jgi:hypothetical protein
MIIWLATVYLLTNFRYFHLSDDGMNRKTIDTISIIVISFILVLLFIFNAHIIKIPDEVGYFIPIVLILAISIPLIIRQMILKKGGEEAEQIKKEMEENQNRRTKNQWVTFIMACLAGLLTASFMIIQINAMFIRTNEFMKNQSGLALYPNNQTELIQKIIGIDIGLSLIIIGGFWLCYIFVEKKESKKDVPFDPFEETKKNKKIPGCMVLVGLLIALLAFVFL